MRTGHFNHLVAREENRYWACLQGVARHLERRRSLKVVDGRPQARERETKLFEEMVLPVLDELFAFACRMERDPARAADLLQDSLLRAFRKFSQLGDATSFRAWMATIIRRTFHNRHRRKGEAQPLPGEDDDRAHELSCSRLRPDERLAARRLGRELKEALDGLPEAQRLAVFLIDVQGYSYDEASRALDLPPGTVASRVARGRASLRARLRHIAQERGWSP